MVKEIIPDDRKDDIAYLEAMLQEVANCLSNKIYQDWKNTNRLIRKDIAMVVTPMDIVGYYKNIIEARTEDTIKDLEDKVIEDFDEFMKDFKDE